MMELYQETNDQSGKQSNSKRSMLILLDRFDDLHTMVYHSWQYLSLIHDIFTIKNNNFNFVEDERAPGASAKTYDIDFVSDALLRKNAFMGFDVAGPSVDEEMKSWKQEYDGLNKSSTSVDAISAQLTDAMDKMPVMTERKKKIDMHVQVASKILHEIKRRELNNL